MSSSESDTSSDESLDQDVSEFVNVMKTFMTNQSNKTRGTGTAHETNTQESARSSVTARSKRQQLYDTFKIDDSLKQNNSSPRKQTIPSEVPLCDFVIDKGKSDNVDMPSFFIDTSSNKDKSNEMCCDTVTEVIDLSEINIDETKAHGSEDEGQKVVVPARHKHKKKNMALSSTIQTGLVSTDLYVNVVPYNLTKKQLSDKKKVEHKEPEILKKSVITDDYEKQDAIATSQSRRQEKRDRRAEREKTKGDKWFNMPATEMTEEIKNDLSVVHMRKALDPKRFYKSNDMKALPKYFQFGTVVESKADFYHSRIPKKQRKSTMVEELLADTEFRKFNKRKYEEIQEAKRMGQGPYKHMKRLKKRKR